MTIASTLNRRRAALGLTAVDVAARAGLPADTVRALERETAATRKLDALCKALGLTLAPQPPPSDDLSVAIAEALADEYRVVLAWADSGRARVEIFLAGDYQLALGRADECHPTEVAKTLRVLVAQMEAER